MFSLNLPKFRGITHQVLSLMNGVKDNKLSLG